MPAVLALDVGARRTGVALADERTQVPVALDSIRHANTDELVSAVITLLKERGVDSVVCGLPLLPSGEEGSQCRFVRSVADLLTAKGVPVSLLDERYSTPRGTESDGDAAAACQLLLTFLDRRKKKS